MFGKVLIANRGEIAGRIVRTLRRWASHRSPSIPTPTVSRGPCSMPTRRCGSARRRPRESYLNVDAIIAACAGPAREAVHPGYGFLSRESSASPSGWPPRASSSSARAREHLAPSA